ncbi:hypothetical protein TNIN_64661 [Trichonephila inaurata madagascariensis]|uniref:Uncharacterized protein n=1 Tax=Trichonephila inaurata madagascariensis TaxID=2747483 RepID=A0A8X7BQT4_9ARAC|nr:hypothetical protein TNIN_64661 [Trichonephila inaurata madagascariensis]
MEPKGAVGKLSHVVGDQNRVLRGFGSYFPKNVGVKTRGKVSGYAKAKGIVREMVPINRRSATIPLNRNRPIHAKRNHFRLKPGIPDNSQSQGGTFKEIVSNT